MSLPSYLAKIKSAGVYRFVWDKSVVPQQTAETLRLVVGYSEKGPFNTPVYIEKVSDFYNIFGNTNKKLERKGIYFHRMAIQALAGGPILALNLKPFTSEDPDASDEDNAKVEKTQYISINPSEMLKHKLIQPKTVPITDVYDTNRFWYLDADKLPNKLANTSYLSLVHTDVKDRACSIFMRPSNPVGYNMTIRDWYKNIVEEEMPSYLEPIQHELVSKYFMDVFVFRGKFTPELVKEGGSLGNYVTEYSNGVVSAQKWNGYFKIQYPDSVLPTTITITEGDSEVTYNRASDHDSVFPVGAVNRQNQSIAGDASYAWEANGTYAYSAVDTPEFVVVGENYFKELVLGEETYALTDKEFTFEPGSTDFSGNNITGTSAIVWESASGKCLISLDEDPEYVYIIDSYITSSTPYADDWTSNFDIPQTHSKWTECESNYELNDPLITINTDYKNAYGEKVDALAVLASDSTSNFIQSYTGCLLPYFKDSMGNYVSIDILFNLDHDYHNMLMKLDEEMLDKIASNVIEDDSDYAKNNLENVLYCQDVYQSSYVYVDVENVTEAEKEQYTKRNSIPDLTIYSQDKLQSMLEDPNFNKILVNGLCYKLEYKNNIYVDGDSENYIYLTPMYIEGYTYKTIQNDDNGIILQDKILKVLEDKGIRTALTNRVDVDYHYIIDTFKSYVYSNCKSKISLIAKEKDNAFALLNFPPMADFISSNKFTTNKKFDIAKLGEARYGFSLPSENEGASHCAFFTNVTFSDGTLKTNVPSAAIVSNNFIKKYEGNLKPYNIIAGPNRGLVSYSGMVGPDYNYGRSDLDVLEPMGVNAIIYVPRKGVYINSNQTAKQSPVSALSKIHIRELVIYIQDEIENILQNYQWELNTQTLRDAIKTSADYVLGKIMADGGLYAYSTVCDSSNNTPEIIDNEMLVLDISIEPARGAGKMVQQITIHKTGGISSSATA